MCTHARAFIFLYYVTLSKLQRYFKTDFKKGLEMAFGIKEKNKKKKQHLPLSQILA